MALFKITNKRLIFSKRQRIVTGVIKL